MGFFNDIEDHYAAELKAAIDTWGLDAANRIWTNVPDKPLVKLPFVSVETIGLMPGGLQNTDRMELTHEFCIAFPVNHTVAIVIIEILRTISLCCGKY